MKKLLACVLLLVAPLSWAQDKENIVTHMNGLDVRVEPMGVTPSSDDARTELIGTRAVRVINDTAELITCNFHASREELSSSMESPTFTVQPNAQSIERVPGEYSPERPYAEITCERAGAALGN